MVTVSMPQLGESVTEGTIGRWLKQPGEQVDKYEPLVEITTDKVNAEIPSPYAGVLQEIIAPEGETVNVGARIAVIAVPGTAEIGTAESSAPVPSPEPVRNQAAGEGAGPAGSLPTTRIAQTESALPATAPSALDFGPTGGTRGDAEGGAPVITRPAALNSAGNGAAEPRAGGARRRYTPLVLRLAEQHEIPLEELSRLPGSGLGGRVGKDDVLRYLESRPSPAAGGPPATATPPLASQSATPSASDAPGGVPAPSSPARAGDVLPLTPIRKAIAEHMVRSVATSPHAWTMVEIDMTAVAAHRAATKDEFARREGIGLSFLPYFVEAVAASLKEFPVLNSSFTAQGIELKRDINIGIAVALEHQQGLVVPVIKRADEMNRVGLARALNDLVLRARNGKLTLDDMRGGTFTVNNPGSFGSILSQPIINQPQAAIVTMEAIVKRPVVVSVAGSDSIAIRQLMNVAISFDHRILDGLTAGQFLGAVKRRLEDMPAAN